MTSTAEQIAGQFANNNGKGVYSRLDSVETRRTFVSYSQFGAKLDGISDDTSAILAAHEFANTNGLPIRQTKGKIRLLSPVVVKTDTDLSGCELYTNDDLNGLTLFRIKPEEEYQTIISFDQTQLQKGATRLSTFADYHNCLIRIDSSELFGYRGGNAGSPAYKSETFVHIRDGAIIGGPLQNDFTSGSLTVQYKKVSDSPVTFRAPKIKWNFSNKDFFCNVIECSRSNTTIDTVSIEVTNLAAINSGGASKGGVITVYDCVNVSVLNVNGENITSTLSTESGYVLSTNHTVNLLLRNMHVLTGWGAIGTNFAKNTTVENSTINRFDCHRGIGDTHFSNVTFYGAWGALIGWGNGRITFDSCKTIYTNSFDSGNRNNIVYLRADWGAIFEGSIHISDHVLDSLEDRELIVIACYNSYANTNNLTPLTIPSVYVSGLVNKSNFNKHVTGYYVNLSNFVGESRKLTLPKVISFKDVICENESDANYFKTWECLSNVSLFSESSRMRIELTNVNKSVYSKYKEGFTSAELATVGAYMFQKDLLYIMDATALVGTRYDVYIDNCSGGVRLTGSIRAEINNSKITALQTGDNAQVKELNINNSKIYPYPSSAADLTYLSAPNATMKDNIVYCVLKDGIHLPLNINYGSSIRLLKNNSLIGRMTAPNSLLTLMDSSSVTRGPTGSRPTTNLYNGRYYFDETLNKPIWYNGSGWIDSTGTVV